MKNKTLAYPALFLVLFSIVGCSSSSEVTVNPAPEVTPAQIEQMDAESDRARQEAIKDGA